MKKIILKNKNFILKKKRLLESLDFLNRDLKKIEDIIDAIVNRIINGGKILLCGNGGSAADAQHLAAEFTVRLRPNVNRQPIPALSLSSDISTLTACANDYGFKNVFLRNFQALYKKNDLLIVISTSGNSENILEVLKYSKKKKNKINRFTWL